ncbi:hypothetical protein [Arthrobacter sp. KK5.5]|uniref:hypothetical protein n=1 Tax=Arthrobacter sp. KK5.5 TaxID=3373084 RepID=UPI003EE5AB9C
MATRAPQAAAPRTRLRIRTGPAAVAAAGALAAVVLVVGGALAPFGVVSGMVPLLAALVLVASFAGLRMLAVAGRRRRALARMEAAFAEAMQAPRTESNAPRRETKLFDAQPAQQVEPASLTVHELRAAARRVAADAGPRSVKPPTWDPVEVPKPTYVDAAKAERPAPAALPQPEEKKATGVTSILQDTRVLAAAEARDAAPDGVVAGPGERTGAARGSVAESVPLDTGRINLDAVLQRRRA